MSGVDDYTHIYGDVPEYVIDAANRAGEQSGEYVVSVNQDSESSFVAVLQDQETGSCDYYYYEI